MWYVFPLSILASISSFLCVYCFNWSFYIVQTSLSVLLNTVYYCCLLLHLLFMSSLRLLSLLLILAIRRSQLISADSILRSCSFFTVKHYDPYKNTVDS